MKIHESIIVAGKAYLIEKALMILISVLQNFMNYMKIIKKIDINFDEEISQTSLAIYSSITTIQRRLQCEKKRTELSAIDL